VGWKGCFWYLGKRLTRVQEQEGVDKTENGEGRDCCKKVTKENQEGDTLKRQGLYPENSSLCPYEWASSVLSGSR
jgi:hypothetical protein